MAATVRPDVASNDGLRSALAVALPRDRRFHFYHVSTPPLKTAALCSAPPGKRTDRTYCERHVVGVSVDVPPAKQVLVLAMEVLVFTTAHATTVFVSKADSTGYLDLLRLPRGTPSPIRGVCTAVVAHLVATRRRSDVPLVVSLFARAQGQYLFPGSAKHAGKHVLDDQGLVRWWCRVLDPLLVSPPCRSVRGYLLVPGLDAPETRAFLPKSDSPWSLGHPLERISHYYREIDWVPPRCLVLRFPDDPKSRFRDELDDEAAKSGAMQLTGSWRSVKTLDTFWEMMAFRQECSSGRLTGFIWVVFDDVDSDAEPAVPAPETPKKQRPLPAAVPNTTPKRLFPGKARPADGTPFKKASSEKKDEDGEQKANKDRKKTGKKLAGPIRSRQPRIKTKQRNYLLDQPTSSKYFYWPLQGRGERIVDESGYKRIVDLLLHLDFATLDKATGSTDRWIGEAGMASRWGFEVTGTRDPLPPEKNGHAGPEAARVNNLSGLVKRKRADTTEGEAQDQGRRGVEQLGAGLVRKKPKA